MTTPNTPATIARLRELTGWRGNSDDDGEHEEDLDLADWQIRAIYSALQSGAIPIPDDAPQLDAQAAEIERLRAELAVERQCRNGHMPDCAGIDLEQMRCGCGYLDGTAYRSLADEIERLKAECIREHDREFAPFCEQSERADKAEARVEELEREPVEARKPTVSAVTAYDAGQRDAEERVKELEGLLRRIVGDAPAAMEAVAGWALVRRADLEAGRAALSKREGGR